MKGWLIAFIMTVLLFPVLYLLLGLKIFVIYLLIWVDKIVIGLFRPLRIMGFELTTLSSVLAAIFYGPLVSFVLTLVIFTFLQSLRYLVFPIQPPDFPLFVPNKDSIIYAAGGLAAGFLSSLPFSQVVIFTVLVKSGLYAVTDILIMKKSRYFITLLGIIITHLLILIPFGLELMKFIQ